MKTRKLLIISALLLSVGSLLAFKPAKEKAYPTLGYFNQPNGPETMCITGNLEQNDCATFFTGPQCTIKVSGGGTFIHYPAYQTFDDVEGPDAPCMYPYYQFN